MIVKVGAVVGQLPAVADDTLTALVQGEDETFYELLCRLIERRREAVLGGTGLRAVTDAVERAREARMR